jgi:ribonuclease E
MTRKLVGQGLIEAFSTTCESCGGRGIHIHSEPVKKTALDKDMDQRYVPQSYDEDESSSSEESESPVADTTEIPEVADVVAEEAPKPAARKRRRAVSTGIITPE